MAVLTMESSGPGYCQVCGRPAQLGALRLADWPYPAWVCASCLRAMAASVERNGHPRVSDGS